MLECYAYHRPLRAVARALATMGIPIAPGTLADAQSRLLGVFEPLDEAIAERQRAARLVQGDETRWMIHVRGERGENPSMMPTNPTHELICPGTVERTG